MPNVTIIGNLTADPELKFINSGAAVANFTIAETPRVYDKAAGEWKDGQTTFWRCSLWRDHAENLAESLVKGARVIATGKTESRSYDKDGENRTVTEVKVDEIGPSLKYATATVVKRGRGDRAAAVAPASNGWAADSSEDAPF